jgi:hypothetical protein
MWLITALLLFNAWLLGIFGFLLAAVGLSLTALTATDDAGIAVRLGSLSVAIGVWGILSLLALSAVLPVEHVLVIEFLLCSAVYVYVLLGDVRAASGPRP